MAVIDLAIAGTSLAALIALGRLFSVVISLESRFVRLEITQAHMREQIDKIAEKL